MDTLQLIGPTYPSFALATEAQATFNLYPEFVDSGDKADAGRAVLTGTPGRSLALTSGASNNCGSCIVPSNIPFIPNGSTAVPIAYYLVADGSPNTLYALNAHMSAGAIVFTKTLINGGIAGSAINSGTNGYLPAQILVLNQVGASGQDLLFVVSGGKAYLYSFGQFIATAGVAAGGSGYAVNDTGTIPGWGGYPATYKVLTVSGGSVGSISITNAGSGYVAGSSLPTATGGLQPGSGTGLLVTITVSSAAWTGYQLAIPNTDVSFTNYIASATFMDGYVVVSLAENTVGAGSREFYNSAVNDASSWSPQSVSTKEGNPDPVAAVYAWNELLGIFGTQTIEIWYDAGVSASGSLLVPFQRISGGGVINVGLASTDAICSVAGAGSIAWLGCDESGNNVAWVMNGYTPQRISNHAVENAWRNYNVIGSSLYSYQENGHTFLVFNFPIAPNGPDGTLSASTIGATWAYDLATQMWHQRGSYTGTTAPTVTAPGFNNEFPRFHAFVQNVGHLMLDYFSGNIYVQSLDTFSDVSQNSGSSNAIARLRRTPHFRDGLKRIGYPHVRVLAQAGNGSMTLSIDNDGGFTYIPISTLFMGFLPLQPLDWWRTGYARDRIFQLFSTDAIKQVWVEGYAEFNDSLSQF